SSQSKAGLFVKKLGESRVAYDKTAIFHTFWPLDYLSEQDQVRQTVNNILSSQGIGALIINQAIPGSAAAIANAAAWREHCFIVACSPLEETMAIAQEADLVLAYDLAALGLLAAEQAANMNAQALVYYFNKQQSGVYAQQYDLAEQTCIDLDMEFIPVELPEDAHSDVEKTKFFTKDVAEKIAKHGKDTAFFSADAAFAPQILISQIIAAQAIFPLPCQPSPYAGLPQALGMEINDNNYGDYEYVKMQVKQILLGKGLGGRLANFTVDWEDLEIITAYEYVSQWLRGEVKNEKPDIAEISKIMENISGTPCHLRLYEKNGVVYNNYILYYIMPTII
ncbi:MAG: DUF3798 domain-containing protein, partial [Firmicutes bacterium]|nr:DUF3798 domain-containing protein [Bacillota bacterium]